MINIANNEINEITPTYKSNINDIIIEININNTLNFGTDIHKYLKKLIIFFI